MPLDIRKVDCPMKMKMLILGVGVFGLAAMVSGQQPQLTHRPNIVLAPSTAITVNDIRQENGTNTTFARGGVSIETPSSTITADEADIHHLKDTRTAVDLDIELRGNVHVVITPQAK
jgi:lipopolysaccharide assembly outer membrane protein LptD (OstA)